MWRQVVADTLSRCIARYGGAEVAAWHIETWNEPDMGWGWEKIKDPADPVLAAYVSYWDASAAGVEDVEAATGVKLYFGGTASGGASHDKLFLPAMLDHKSAAPGGGVNEFTGAPVRWDYLTAHVKGESTSFVTVLGELNVSALIRSKPAWSDPAAGLIDLPISNDEGDPMVGWETPEVWRGDARYGAILPKMVNQHLVAIADVHGGGGQGVINPLGWLSFDGAFMNGVGDNYTGFGERSFTARFGKPSSSTPFAFVRKNGLASLSMLSKLPTASRCAYTPYPTSQSVLSDTLGLLASIDAIRGDAGVLVYNSPDCAPGGSENSTVYPRITLSNLPWPPGTPGALLTVYALNDDPSISTSAAWVAQGSPLIPTPAQLKELWTVGARSGGSMGAPYPLTLNACTATTQSLSSSSSSSSCVVLPSSIPLPNPGLLLYHVAVPEPAAGEGGPPPPPSVTPYVKPPGASLLPRDTTSEIFVRWDCTHEVAVISRYEVQVSVSGVSGPWAPANPLPEFPPDTLCSFTHALSPPVASPLDDSLFYRVRGVDYWGRLGNWSNASLAVPWPSFGG